MDFQFTSDYPDGKWRTYHAHISVEYDDISHKALDMHVESIKLDDIEIPMDRDFIVLLEQAAWTEYEGEAK